MDKCNDALDWKKVFKKILGGQGQSVEDKSLCFGESEKGSSSTADLGSGEHEIQGSITSNSFVNHIDLPKDYGPKSFKALNLGGKTVYEIKTQDSNGSIKQNYNFHKGDKNIQVPEWNTVFKSLLDKKSSVCVVKNQEISSDSVKKDEKLQKPSASVKTRCVSRKKFHKEPETKESPEEKKVRELFALSRTFKLDYYNLNDYEGAGVDIFKCGKNACPKSFVKSTGKAELADKALALEHESDSDSESCVPLKGFIAKYKPYTNADLLASPPIPFTEDPWDDELLI